MSWLIPYWANLCAGGKVTFHSFPEPESLGFRRIVFAEQVGQVGNWALPLQDGSRLHLWRMPDRTWILHRDAIDPGRGPIHAAVHIVKETRIGPALVGMATVAGLLVLATWAFKG